MTGERSNMYTVVLKYLLLFLLVANLSCRYDASPKVGIRKTDLSVGASPPSQAVTPFDAQTGSIRSVDFSNFTYAWYPKWESMLSEAKEFTLRNGKLEVDAPRNSNEPVLFELLNVQYGDVSQDGLEDAIVTIKMSVRGNAKPYVVFVITLTNGKPNMLWSHEAGDRADEGLRNVYISDKHLLVIEQYNANELVSPNREVTKVGMCCPTTFTRTFYKWDKDRFESFRRETLRNEYPDARVLVRS